MTPLARPEPRGRGAGATGVLLPAALEPFAAWPRWVGWKNVSRSGKARKLPVQAGGGRAAKANDPATWAPFAEVAAAVSRLGLAGAGIMLGELGDGRFLVGLDLDLCRSPVTGLVEPWARTLVERWGTYAEVSPSGTGVKLFGYATRPLQVPVKEVTVDAPVPDGAEGGGHERPEIGLYPAGRYFTVTGLHLEGSPDQLTDVTVAAAELAAELAGQGRQHRGLRPRGPAREPRPFGEVPADAVERLLTADPTLAAAWRSGAKLTGGGDASASGLDWSLAIHLGRGGHPDPLVAAALRAYPHGQLGGGRLAGGEAERRLAMLLAAAGEARETARACPYAVEGGGIVWRRPTRDGERVPVRLTNFAARIVGQVERDDGAERTRAFTVEATLAGRTRRFDVPAPDFAGLGWVTRELGAKALVYPGPAVRDHARAAIQMLSDELEERRVHGHTGWRETDAGTVYLHAGGAVGAAGAVAGVETDLGPAGLGLFALPAPPDGERLAAAVRASLRLLDLGPAAVSAPILAAVYRAPLGPADFALHLAGPTGAFKSQLAALAQQHWGAGMDAQHLPGSWLSTGNALEGLAFAAKDALLAVDDFAPGGSADDVRRLHREAGRLLRAQGNNAGRQRMRPDGSLRPPRPPRGLVLSTGEDVPGGQSVRARCLVVELRRGDVDAEALTACQRDAGAGLYAESMAGYLRWLAADLDGRRASFRARRDELRRERIGAGAHARTPWMMAELAAALGLFLEFAAEVGAVAAAEADVRRAAGLVALRQAAAGQAEHQRAEDPARRFVALVAAALASQEAHLADAARPEEPPAGPEAWGWQRAEPERRNHATGALEPPRWRAMGRRIGWTSGERVYLDPEAAYAAAQELARKQGGALQVAARTLWRRLDEAGLLAAKDKGRNTYKATVGGGLRNVLALAVLRLRPEPGKTGSSRNGIGRPGDPAAAFPSVPPTSSAPGNGREQREAAHAGVGPVPGLPDFPDAGAIGEAPASARWECEL